MSTRWNPTLPPRQEPDANQKSWRKYLLPAAGGGAVLLIVIIIAAIFAAGGNDENDDSEEISLATDAEATQTAEAIDEDATPTPEPTIEIEATPTPERSDDENDDNDNNDDAEPTPTPEADPTPEPVAEEQPAEEPTPQPEPQTEETIPEPDLIVGDFGELPPGNMPSGDPSITGGFQMNLDMSLQNVPTQAAAYRVNPRQWALGDVQSLANRLGIDADVVDQGGGSFRAEGSSASIYISPTMTQYVRAPGGAGALPGNDQVIQTARSWLVEHGLVGADAGSGRIVDRNEDGGRATVEVKPVDPPEIISATPSARVTVQGEGTIVEATISWPSALQSSTYSLRSAQALWADASQGRGFVDLPPSFQGASGTITITSSRIAYTIAGSPQGEQYLVPIVAFSGTAATTGGGTTSVNIYVQAAAAQAIPRG
jgi:outer membrane biosynthesis protein TonB